MVKFKGAEGRKESGRRTPADAGKVWEGLQK
jgi:hypothetical protein